MNNIRENPSLTLFLLLVYTVGFGRDWIIFAEMGGLNCHAALTNSSRQIGALHTHQSVEYTPLESLNMSEKHQANVYSKLDKTKELSIFSRLSFSTTLKSSLCVSILPWEYIFSINMPSQANKFQSL